MRVYNGTKSQLDLPLSNLQRITIPAHAVSGDIMPSTEFLSLLVGSYDYSEIALIVSGPYEINMCAGVSGSTGFVVQSLEEAIERFAPKEIVTSAPQINSVDKEPENVVEEQPENCPTCESEPCVCEEQENEEITVVSTSVENTKGEEDCKKPVKKNKKSGK